MWDDNEWQYHQDSRDAAANDGALVLIGLVVAAAIVLAVAIFIH